MQAELIFKAIINEFKKRVFQESMERIRFCLGQLSEEEIWYRPNNNSNSVGNLVLHLEGNARQWIIAGLSDQKDTRDRDSEFNEKGPLPTAQLIAQLKQLQEDLTTTLSKLRPEDLLKNYQVQGFEESGISMLVHVIEHFSYHTGQITYIVKAKKNMDTGYYSGIDLNLK